MIQAGDKVTFTAKGEALMTGTVIRILEDGMAVVFLESVPFPHKMLVRSEDLEIVR